MILLPCHIFLLLSFCAVFFQVIKNGFPAGYLPTLFSVVARNKPWVPETHCFILAAIFACYFNSSWFQLPVPASYICEVYTFPCLLFPDENQNVLQFP